MQQELLIAILAGLGGMLGWGLADFFAKKTIDEIGDISSLTWAHIFGTIVLFITITFRFFLYGQDTLIPNTFYSFGGLIFFGILQAIVYLYVYKGFSKGQVSVLAPFFASFSGITSILSIVFLGEIITGHLIYALITIFIGIILINLDIQAFDFKKINFIKVPGFKEVAIATLLAAVWTLLWSKFVDGQDWLGYAFYMYLFMTVTILFVSKTQKVNLTITNKSIWKFLLLIGLTETLAYLAVSFGYSMTSETSVVALLSGAFSLPTIVLAYVFLKERVTKTQRIGSIVIIIGIIILSVL